MHRRRLVLSVLATSLVLAAAACWYDVPDVVTDSGGSGDVITSDGGGGDAPAADVAAGNDGGCDANAPFGAPTIVVTDTTYAAYDKRAPFLSADELTVYFASGLNGVYQIYYATRSSWSAPFAQVSGNVSGLQNGTNGSDNSISVGPDGLLALLGSTRYEADNPGASQVWSAARSSPTSPFGAITWSNTGFGSHLGDWDPYIVDESAGLYYFYYASLCGTCSAPNNTIDIHYALYDGGGPGAYVGLADSPNLNSPVAADHAPVLTQNQQRIYFASDRTLDGGVAPGNDHIWTSYRPSATGPWVPPTLVSELADAAASLRPGWISPNGCRLYFDGKVGATYEIFVATRGN